MRFIYILLIINFLPFRLQAQESAEESIDKAGSLLSEFRFEEAAQYFENAASAYENQEELSFAAHCYIQAARAHLENQDFSAAYISLHLTDLAEKNTSPEPGEKAEKIFITGRIDQLKGNFTAAESQFSQTAELIAGKKEFELLGIEIQIARAEIAESQDRLKEAIQSVRKAHFSLLKLVGENHRLVIQCYNLYGKILSKQGAFSAAEENYEKALLLCEKNFKIDSPEKADAYAGIGLLNLYKDSKKTAEEYIQRARAINSTLFGSSHIRLIDNLIHLADIKKNEGNYPEAMDLYNKALRIGTEGYDVNHPARLPIYLGLGNINTLLTKYSQAINFYNTILKVNATRKEPDKMINSAVYNNVAGIFYYNGDYEEALKNYKKSLAIDLKIHGKKHPDVAGVYGNIGRLYSEQGIYDKALEYYQQAIIACTEDFENTNIYINPPLKNYFAQNDLLWYLQQKAMTLQTAFGLRKNINGLKAALQTYSLCDSLADKIRRSHNAQSDKIKLGETAAAIYSGATATAYDLYKLASAGASSSEIEHLKTECVERVFYFSEKNKANVLASSVSESKAKTFGGIPDDMLEKENDYRIKINDYLHALAKTDDSLTVEIYTEKLFRMNREYEDLILELEERYPKYFTLKYDEKNLSVADIQASLDEKTVLISFFMTYEGVYSTVISRSGAEIFKGISGKQAGKLIRIMRNGILYRVNEDFAEAAHELYAGIMPEKLAEGIEKMILIPDGNLLTVPFEALLTEKPSKEALSLAKYSDFPFLVKKYAVAYAFSARLMSIAGQNGLSKQKPLSWIGIAPVFDGNDRAGSENAEAILNEINKNSVSGVSKQGYVNSIPATEEEVKTIQSMFLERKFQAANRLRKDADEGFMKSDEIQKYSIIHIATHGFTNSAKPELSGILLSPGEKEDGILHSGEIYNIKLDADLMILSACETGLGKVSKGEGMIGLTRALLFAGTKNLIVSFWKVSDESTAELMISFYDRLTEIQKESEAVGESQTYFSEPLRAAKLKMIQSPKYSAPFYWSPFVLLGK